MNFHKKKKIYMVHIYTIRSTETENIIRNASCKLRIVPQIKMCVTEIVEKNIYFSERVM